MRERRRARRVAKLFVACVRARALVQLVSRLQSDTRGGGGGGDGGGVSGDVTLARPHQKLAWPLADVLAVMIGVVVVIVGERRATATVLCAQNVFETRGARPSAHFFNVNMTAARRRSPLAACRRRQLSERRALV